MKTPKKIALTLAENPKVRKEVAKESFYYFILVYFSMYLKYDFGAFQEEMIELAENERNQTIVISGFRSCGKSSILTVFYPIWCILGMHQKKYILIVCKTMEQAEQTGKNIKAELESNNLLKQDMGPFEERRDWSSVSFLFKRHGARIKIVSIEQSIRGTRHGHTRPEIIICDDIEDVGSTRTQERRNKTDAILTREIIPAGDKDTRLIIIGNMLHEDSIINRFRTRIKEKRLKGKYRRYPIEKNGKSLWPSKFPNKKAIEDEKMRIGDYRVWDAEYMLKIVSDKDAVCERSWIRYYEELPTNLKFNGAFIAVDPATSEDTRNDYTAIFACMLFAEKVGNQWANRVYILPRYINKRIKFGNAITEILNMHDHVKTTYGLRDSNITVLIENAGQQRTFYDQLTQVSKFPPKQIKLVSTGGMDKRSRLAGACSYMQSERVFFPKGMNEPVTQILGFGHEKHDDMADAIAMLVNTAMAKGYKRIGMAVGDMHFAYIIDPDNPNQKIQGWEDGLGMWHPGNKADYYRRLKDMDDRGLL